MAKYALTIGINRYQTPGNDLYGCVQDAKDWTEALQARGFDVETLLDEGATGSRIRDRIRSLLAEAKYRDRVVLTASCHGTWVPDRDGDEPDRRDEALCPHDFGNGLILDDELYRLFQSRAFGVRLVFISDSCHSGTVYRVVSAQGQCRPRFLPPAVFLTEPEVERALRVQHAPSRGLSRPGALLMAACRDDQVAWDAWYGNRPNGAFTRTALDALARNPRNYRDWMNAIRETLPSKDYPQTPTLQASPLQKYWQVL